MSDMDNQNNRNEFDDDAEPVQNGASSSNEMDDFAGEPDPNEEIARMALEVADHKDRYLRTLAEMDNMRRRLERERSDLIKFGLESFIKDLLPVLDSLQNALPDDLATKDPATSSTEADGSYLNGMLMVKRQLFDVLQKHGLEPVSAAGKAFDPNQHQAIQRVESQDVSADTVKDEYARGYTLHGRLIRPAMVSVLTPSN